MSEHNCCHCKLRSKYDHNPKSLLGRLWRWHIGFCPGWKAYLKSLPPAEQAAITTKYSLRAS